MTNKPIFFHRCMSKIIFLSSIVKNDLNRVYRYLNSWIIYVNLISLFTQLTVLYFNNNMAVFPARFYGGKYLKIHVPLSASFHHLPSPFAIWLAPYLPCCWRQFLPGWNQRQTPTSAHFWDRLLIHSSWHDLGSQNSLSANVAKSSVFLEWEIRRDVTPCKGIIFSDYGWLS